MLSFVGYSQLVKSREDIYRCRLRSDAQRAFLPHCGRIRRTASRVAGVARSDFRCSNNRPEVGLHSLPRAIDESHACADGCCDAITRFASTAAAYCWGSAPEGRSRLIRPRLQRTFLLPDSAYLWHSYGDKIRALRKDQSRTEDIRAYAEAGSEAKTARCRTQSYAAVVDRPLPVRGY